MNAEPTRNPSAPSSLSSSMSRLVFMPLSDITGFSFPIILRRSLFSLPMDSRLFEVASDTSKVSRSLLFIPTKSASESSANINSFGVCASRSTSRPRLCARENISSRLALASLFMNTAAMKRTASAPISAPASIWTGSMMMSFMRTGHLD